jgi:hypothetical protein
MAPKTNNGISTREGITRRERRCFESATLGSTIPLRSVFEGSPTPAAMTATSKTQRRRSSGNPLATTTDPSRR